MAQVYQCPECGKEFAEWELPQDVALEEKPKCPQCGAELEQTF